MDKSYLTTEQAAGYLGLSTSYLAKLRMTDSPIRGPRYTRIGLRGIRYAVHDLDHWMNARAVPNCKADGGHCG